MSHIPAGVSKVKKANTPITNAAETPDKIGSKLFLNFIYIFPIIQLYTLKGEIK